MELVEEANCRGRDDPKLINQFRKAVRRYGKISYQTTQVEKKTHGKS